MIGYIAIGLVSGIISGMGIGGGAVLIPALTFIYKLDQHQAQNINLIYFIPTAIIALFSHFRDGNVEKKILPSIIIFGLGGAFLGSMIAVNLEAQFLRKAFGVFLLFMGVYEFFGKTKEEKNG